MHRASRHGTSRSYEARIGDLERLANTMLRRQDDIARAILAGGLQPAAVNAAYRSTLEEALLADLRVARWLAWVLYDCPRLRVRLLRRYGPSMSELMTRIVTGETTYRAIVRRPGNYLKLLRRAA